MMMEKKRTSKDSLTYWKEREIDHAKSVMKDQAKINKEIVKLYKDAQREIEKEINYMVARYADKSGFTIAEARKLVSQTDIKDFETKAKRYVKEKNFSKLANEEMAIYNLKMKVSRLELIDMHVNLELIALTDSVEKLTEGRLLKVGKDELLRQSGILGQSLNLDNKGIEYIAKRKFHGDDFSVKLWRNKDLLHNEMRYRLSEGIIKGQNPRVGARKLRDVIEQSRYNAERLMITETARVQTEIQKESFLEIGFDSYEFIAESSACKDCIALDGKIFKVVDMMPGENASPIHPHCMCSAGPVMSREAFEADLASRGL